MGLLRTKRLAAHKSQHKLAVELGITGATIANWEKGTSVPKPRRWPQLAAALGITVRQLAYALSESASKPAGSRNGLSARRPSRVHLSQHRRRSTDHAARTAGVSPASHIYKDSPGGTDPTPADSLPGSLSAADVGCASAHVDHTQGDDSDQE
jgi:transcriptional regulator with XRE-family HTH domain